LLLSVPDGVTAETVPVVAPFGTVTLILDIEGLGFFTKKVATFAPPECSKQAIAGWPTCPAGTRA
jgi:hypothetical protein